MKTAEVMLSVSHLTSGYGKKQILREVTLRVGEREVVSLMGRNGMGKTTTLRTLMGLTRAWSGRVEFSGKDISRATPEAISRIGLGYVPEGRGIFPNLTVYENLIMSARRGPWSLARVYDLFPRLQERRRQRAKTLSGGEQQMLAIGRGLMTNPDCLIMDEPSEGLAPIIIQGLWEAIGRLKAEGLSILLVEQNSHLALKLVDFVHVMSKGKVVYSAKPDELLANEKIRSSFLGI